MTTEFRQNLQQTTDSELRMTMRLHQESGDEIAAEECMREISSRIHARNRRRARAGTLEDVAGDQLRAIKKELEGTQ